MKKVMLVITIVTALSFLVSMIAVSPLFAAKAIQTTPTTKQQTQQGPAQSPATQKSPIQKNVVQARKTEFWDLEFGRLEVKGVVITKGGGNKTINVAPGETVTLRIYYKVKTPPVKDITEADVKYWGSGKLTYYTGLGIEELYEVEPKKHYSSRYIDLRDAGKNLPKFTWADVTNWIRARQGNDPKIWNEATKVFQWTPGETTCEAWIHVLRTAVNYSTTIPTIPEANIWNNPMLWLGANVRFIIRHCEINY